MIVGCRMMYRWLSARGSLVWRWRECWWNAISTRRGWWSCRRQCDGQKWSVHLENIQIWSTALRLHTLVPARRSQASGICKSVAHSSWLKLEACNFSCACHDSLACNFTDVNSYSGMKLCLHSPTFTVIYLVQQQYLFAIAWLDTRGAVDLGTCTHKLALYITIALWHWNAQSCGYCQMWVWKNVKWKDLKMC